MKTARRPFARSARPGGWDGCRCSIRSRPKACAPPSCRISTCRNLHDAAASTSPVWHPFTQHALTPDTPLVARGEGAWLETADGTRILDAISSWWVITHGHRHPAIVAAIKRQIDLLDQVIFAGFTHQPPRTSPAALSPSRRRAWPMCSIPTAARPPWRWRSRWRWASGATAARTAAASSRWNMPIMATPSAPWSAGARGVFNAAYEPMLFDVARLPFPAPGREQDTLDALEAAAPAAAAAYCRAAYLRRRRHADLFAGNPRGDAAHLPTPRHPVHRRRSDDRLRPHRHPVRLRTGRHRARHPVRRQGPHRRQPAARRHAVPRRHFRGPLLDRPRPHVFSFQFLHRQSRRLRRRLRQSANLAGTNR